MAKLAILFLAVVAFQATSAGVPRFFGGETMMMTTKFDTMGHWGMHTVGDYTMQMHMWFKKLMDCCEHTMMTKDMMMTCIRKLMTVCDYCIEKLCMEGKCDSTMMHEICMEFKNIKMMLERCLTCDFHEMKMECMECCKMFFRCCEKMMMCDNCCVGFDAICKDICMCWVDFCKSVCGGMGMHAVGDYTMQMHMWFKKMMACCEHSMMTKDMMMTCIRKFMTVCDYCIEKLCMGGKCDSTMMHEICMEFKNIKMMLERCLMCDFHEMKMEWMECCKMFFRCCEKMMMCDNCCVGFDVICKEICMCWVDFCKSVCGSMGMHAVGDYTMQMHMWFKKLMACCEHSMMTKDMMMTCIRKFMTVCDYCIEKLCMEGKCHNVMMHEICMEFRNIKMMLERCLMCDFHEMKMEWMECCKMFFRCCEKMMMCDNCCVGFDVICKEICMCWVDFCKTVCNRMYTTKTYGMDTYMYKTMNMMPYFFHRLR